MSRTPDRFPGIRVEEGILLTDDPIDGNGPLPQPNGAMRYISGSFLFKDSVGVFDPRSGADDKDVKVSLGDTTPGFLSQKIVAGTNVAINTLNSGSNETLEIVVAATALPPANMIGQVLFSIDGLAFTRQMPMTTTSGGWISNDVGLMIVLG